MLRPALGTPALAGNWVRRTSVRRPDALAGTMTEAEFFMPKLHRFFEYDYDNDNDNDNVSQQSRATDLSSY